MQMAPTNGRLPLPKMRPATLALALAASAWVMTTSASAQMVYRCAGATTNSGSRVSYQMTPCASGSGTALRVDDTRTEAQHKQARATLQRQLAQGPSAGLRSKKKEASTKADRRRARATGPSALTAHTVGERPFEHVERSSALARTPRSSVLSTRKAQSSSHKDFVAYVPGTVAGQMNER